MIDNLAGGMLTIAIIFVTALLVSVIVVALGGWWFDWRLNRAIKAINLKMLEAAREQAWLEGFRERGEVDQERHQADNEDLFGNAWKLADPQPAIVEVDKDAAPWYSGGGEYITEPNDDDAEQVSVTDRLGFWAKDRQPVMPAPGPVSRTYEYPTDE